jgi:hypothetical protein
MTFFFHHRKRKVGVQVKRHSLPFHVTVQYEGLLHRDFFGLEGGGWGGGLSTELNTADRASLLVALQQCGCKMVCIFSEGSAFSWTLRSLVYSNLPMYRVMKGSGEMVV